MAYGPTGGLGLRAEQPLPLTGTGNGRGDPVEVVNSGVDLGVDLTISF